MKRRDFLKLSGAAALASAYPGGPLLADEIGVDAAAKTITIGGFTPVTGPVPFYAILTRAADAYFKSVNEAGGVNIWKDASEAATNFDGLTRNEGWARSSLDSVTMRQNDPIKVHFEVVFSRYKADGTRYATYQSLWISTKKDGAWGIQARSSARSSAAVAIIPERPARRGRAGGGSRRDSRATRGRV